MEGTAPGVAGTMQDGMCISSGGVVRFPQILNDAYGISVFSILKTSISITVEN